MSLVPVKFRWARGDGKQHETQRLWRSWTGTNGFTIWQGRPFEDQPTQFVYRLQWPSGVTEDYRLLNDAKNRARELCGLTTQRSTQADLIAEIDSVLNEFLAESCQADANIVRIKMANLLRRVRAVLGGD